jgi:DNA-binding CsgD family transcriptional regulator
MHPRLSILVIAFALIAGALAIFLCNRLMRKYALSYLTSYFYYIIFTYIFGVYSIIGSQAIQFLLSDHKIAEETVQSAAGFLLVLGIPFLILGWYMFLRLTRELFQTQLNLLFTILYFGFSLMLFVAYIYFSVYGGSIGSISFHPDMKEIIYIFSGIQSGVFVFGILYLAIKTRKIKDINQRRAYRWFYSWYSVILIFTIVFLNLSTLNSLFGLLFILGFMSFHLVPVLFLQFYLQKYYVSNVEEGSFDEKMKLTTEKYGISKRETEVIELICKGMTNQEISDSLFISVQTVKDHIHRIFLKTGVKNRVQLTNILEK